MITLWTLMCSTRVAGTEHISVVSPDLVPQPIGLASIPLDTRPQLGFENPTISASSLSSQAGPSQSPPLTAPTSPGSTGVSTAPSRASSLDPLQVITWTPL